MYQFHGCREDMMDILQTEVFSFRHLKKLKEVFLRILLSCRRLSQLLSQVLSRSLTSGGHQAFKHQRLHALSAHSAKQRMYIKTA